MLRFALMTIQSFVRHHVASGAKCVLSDGKDIRHQCLSTARDLARVAQVILIDQVAKDKGARDKSAKKK
jgi:hypothetical protein